MTVPCVFFSILSSSCMLLVTWNINSMFSLPMIKWSDASIYRHTHTKTSTTSKEKLMDEKLSWSNVAQKKKESQERCEEKLLCFLFIERINGFVAPIHTTHRYSLNTILRIQLQQIRFISFFLYNALILLPFDRSVEWVSGRERQNHPLQVNTRNNKNKFSPYSMSSFWVSSKC